jgi:Bacterial Ig-like domain
MDGGIGSQVRRGNGSRRGFAWRVALTASLALLVAGMTLVAGAAASTTGDGNQTAQATELVRLLNGEREYHGLSALQIDPFLTTKATDGEVACPDDASLVVEGRAKDIALYGYVDPGPHNLRLCPASSIIDVMRTWDYAGLVGEIYAWNSATDSAISDPSEIYNRRFAYTYGCGDGIWDGCPGTTTWTYYTTAVAASGFMSSPGHRDNVLGPYDRIGCGGWAAPDSSRNFVCILASGGPNPTVAPPPEVPLPEPDPTPAPDPTAGPTPTPASDTIRPSVRSRSPGSLVRGVSAGASVKVVFSERVRGLSRATARVTNLRTGHRIIVSVRYSVTTRTLVIDPRYRLSTRTWYRVDLMPAITDLAGNPLRAISWRFRTR